MIMKKLCSMVDFVFAQTKNWYGNENESYEIAKSCLKYAQFLKQPLELWMFVPCDENGNIYIDYKKYQPHKGTICVPYEGLFEVNKKGKDIELLNEPKFWKEDQRYYNKRKYDEALKKYQQAKEVCIFENNLLSLIVIKELITKNKTVEFLINYHYEQTGGYLETNRELF